MLQCAHNPSQWEFLLSAPLETLEPKQPIRPMERMWVSKGYSSNFEDRLRIVTVWEVTVESHSLSSLFSLQRHVGAEIASVWVRRGLYLTASALTMVLTIVAPPPSDLPTSPSGV